MHMATNFKGDPLLQISGKNIQVALSSSHDDGQIISTLPFQSRLSILRPQPNSLLCADVEALLGSESCLIGAYTPGPFPVLTQGQLRNCPLFPCSSWRFPLFFMKFLSSPAFLSRFLQEDFWLRTPPHYRKWKFKQVLTEIVTHTEKKTKQIPQSNPKFLLSLRNSQHILLDIRTWFLKETFR